MAPYAGEYVMLGLAFNQLLYARRWMVSDGSDRVTGRGQPRRSVTRSERSDWVKDKAVSPSTLPASNVSRECAYSEGYLELADGVLANLLQGGLFQGLPSKPRYNRNVKHWLDETVPARTTDAARPAQ